MISSGIYDVNGASTLTPFGDNAWSLYGYKFKSPVCMTINFRKLALTHTYDCFHTMAMRDAGQFSNGVTKEMNLRDGDTSRNSI